MVKQYPPHKIIRVLVPSHLLMSATLLFIQSPVMNVRDPDEEKIGHVYAVFPTLVGVPQHLR